MAGIITKVLTDNKSQIINQITSAYAKIAKAEGETPDDIVDNLDLDAFLAMVSVNQDSLEAIAANSVNASFKQIGLKQGSMILNPAMVQSLAEAKNRAAELVGKKWVDDELVDNPDAEWAITDGTRELLRADLQDAYDNGSSAQSLADTLEENYAFSEGRAMTIARTEIAKMDSQASINSYRESGVVEGKSWHLGEHACDICQENADQGVIPLNDTFASGDDTSPAHPNCECTVVPEVSELETDNEE